MEGWVCPLCNGVFARKTARAQHMRNMWKPEGDPTRCDNVTREDMQVPLITEPTAAPALLAAPFTAPVPLAAPLLDPLTQLARRKPCTWFDERAQRQTYTIAGDISMDGARNMIALQAHWDTYLRGVASSC